MRTVWIIIIGIVMMSFIPSDKVDLEELRKNYYAAAQDEEDSQTFFNIVEELKTIESAEIKGYVAMSLFLKANYLNNPLKKWSSFKEGKELLEKTIRLNPNNTELVFLRLTIQTNAPKILGYNDNIEQDIGHILKKFKTIKDRDLKTRIIVFLKQFYLTD